MLNKNDLTQNKNMKVEQEKLFIEVATALNLSKAAQNLSISASAVSKQIKSIEAQLGQALVIRSSRALRLTDAGEAYLQTCIQVQDARDGFKEQLAEMDGEIKGKIRVTCPPVYATHVLIPILKQFSEKHPDVYFHIDTNYQNVDIVSKSFDLAIRLGKLEDSSLIAKKLNDVKLYLCCSRDYAEKLGEISSINDLSGAKFIIVEGFELRQSIINQYFSALKIAEDKMVLTTNDTRVHLDSVAAGMGISVLPDYLVQKLIDSGDLVHLFPKLTLASLPLNILYPGQKKMPLRVRKFIDYIYEINHI